MIEDFNEKLIKLIYNIYNKNITIFDYKINNI